MGVSSSSLLFRNAKAVLNELPFFMPCLFFIEMLEFKFARFLIEGRRLGKTDNLEFFEKCELGKLTEAVDRNMLSEMGRKVTGL